MQLRGSITSVSARYVYITIGATLLGVLLGWYLRGGTPAVVPIIPTASAAPPPAPVKDLEGPFHGLSPVFTTRPLESCGAKLGQFCPYESCSASYPLTGPETKYVLWGASVVQGSQGPQVVCEWRHP